MNASITWLDLTASDRDKIRRVLDLFNEQGTVDELGLGTLRDLLSDSLFPGTSVLHTRLRYVFLIPWLYQVLERQRVKSRDVAAKARDQEIRLINALASDEDAEGVIGIQAGRELARLPSSTYWACLVRWGIFLPAQSQGWYHRNFESLVRHREDVPRADDPGVIWTREPTWHPRLPAAPDDFPHSASFALTAEEADFVQGRLQENCADSLLAWLALEGSAIPADRLWEDPDALRAGPGIGEVVELARRFSLHVEGAPLLYNLIVAERRYMLNQRQEDEEYIAKYREEIREWGSREAQEKPFDPDSLWSFAARKGSNPPTAQRRFVETWSEQVTKLGPERIVDDESLKRLIEHRERQLKGPHRARLANEGRLLDWSGRVGVGRMAFRWPNVRQLLIDLHKGLAA